MPDYSGPLVVFVCLVLGFLVGSMRASRQPKRCGPAEPPIYVWPREGVALSEEEPRCAALALAMRHRRESDDAKFVAQWHSGLGQEFPPLGTN